WRRGDAVATVELHSADVDLPEGIGVGSGANRVVDPESARLSNSPGLHEFAANPILKARFALNHQHSRANFGHYDRNGSAAESARYRDDIVLRLDHRDSSLIRGQRSTTSWIGPLTIICRTMPLRS